MIVKNSKTIREALKNGRKEGGRTQEQFSKLVGVSRTTYAMMETSDESLASTSFFTVLKALKLAGVDMHVRDKPIPMTWHEQQENKLKRQTEELPLNSHHGIDGVGPR